MKACRRFVVIPLGVFLALALVLGLAGQAFAAEPIHENGSIASHGKYVQDEIVVKFRGDTKPFRVIRVPEGRVLEGIREYLGRADVEYAEPNYIANALWSPDDQYYPYQWHLDNPEHGGINVEEAWDIETGSPDVVVAVIDTGVAYEDYREGWGWWGTSYYQAPDLAQTSFVPGYDFVNDDNHPNDDDSHGSHVAGTIAQSTDNGIGVAGVAFNCSIMPVKVLDKNGSGTYVDIAEGIRWAADHGANVINLSLGGPSQSTTLKNACAYAYDKGVTIVCAAGNGYEEGNSPCYPAAYDDYCIAVGATRYDNNRAPYSNTGNYLDISAPGGDLTVDQNGDGYGDGVLQNTFNPDTKQTNDFGYWFFQGSSVAAPHVSGVAALLISNGVATAPDNVREALQSTAEDHGAPDWDAEYGWGIVDAHAALMWTEGPLPTLESIAVTPTEASIEVGLTQQFTATGTYSDGSTKDITDSVTWESSDISVATIDATGLATANNKGTTYITAIKDGVSSEQAILTVTDPTLVSIAVLPETASIEVGSTQQFTATGTYSDGSTADLTTEVAWTSSNTAIATIDDSGLATGIDDGVVDIIATLESLTDSASLTVTNGLTTQTMHVECIDMALVPVWGGWMHYALATVVVFDNNGVAVEGATVSGHWEEATTGSVSGDTDAAGEVTLQSGTVWRASGKTFIFVVDDITKDGWVYDSSANVETSDSVTVP